MGSWKQEGCGGQERMPWDLSSSKFKFVSPLSKLAVTLNLPNTIYFNYFERALKV